MSSTMVPSSSSLANQVPTSELLPATATVVLDYLASLSPLPTHLISTPLRQRHHFLSLDLSTPVHYFAWPSSQLDLIADLIHHVLSPRNLSSPDPSPDSFSRNTHFPIRYTVDPESTYAHVRISSGLPQNSPLDPPALRIVFLWESPSWKYHNLALMPFPEDSYATLAEAFQSLHHGKDVQERTFSFPADDIPDEGEDSYWDAYGKDDEDDGGVAHQPAPADADSEDAYWARYASVQGSGDSTLPSPLPIKRKLDMVEPIVIPSEEFLFHPTELYDPLAPPSPRLLTRRLTALSSTTLPSPTLLDESAVTDSDSEPSTPEHHPEISPSPDFVVVNGENHTHGEATESEEVPEPLYQDSDSHRALRDSIRGVYKLWRASLNNSSSLPHNREVFFNIVQQAIADV